MATKITIVSIAIFLSLSALSAQQTLTETMVHDGITRKYIVYVPAVYDGANPVPLMFNFHGYTGQASGHMNGSGMRPVADTAGFILVYPQGSLFFGNTHWNVGSWTNGSTADDIGFTAAMIDRLAAEYNIDLKRVYSCGFSNGGYFSFELACQLSARIAAIASVGGKMSSQTYNSCNPVHPTPVLTIHGTADNIVSYYGSQPVGSKTISEVNSFWTNYNNTDPVALVQNMPDLVTWDGSTVEYHSYKDGDHCTAVDHYKVIGGGHDWPGVWGNRDIDASSVIWNFVSQYDINGLIGCSITSTTAWVDESDEILIFPNPAKEFITINLDLSGEMDYHIYSLAGKIVLSGRISPGNKTIGVSDLPSNIYFINLGDKNIKVIITK